MTEVAAKDLSAAELAQQSLQKGLFLRELKKQGLPDGEILSSSIKVIIFQTFKSLRTLSQRKKIAFAALLNIIMS